ncbi:DUF4132 domain-containing protein [Sinomicrobium pectinilyticum]|uniref:DUF4132 domain-containing protein n=1 Tax=Sinomicrobium pectinilyticum TaxID=1084421 RepID=A0A3N0E508_SINP1|nr:DUF4132 domain-containing protein [Sinomicrobium pectinilyticum]RNL82910.1 DUF4132 domain-containing protein [Sinomicrobium pectinilyticum]
MITQEQAREYIGTQQKIQVTEKDLSAFSRPYQVLGRIITNQTRKTFGSVAHITIYVNHVSKDPAFNPWRSAEGRRLAELLFGSIRAPYIEGIWDLVFSLPYQTGYYRRPFRNKPSVTYNQVQLQQLQSLYSSGIAGFAFIPFEEQIRYGSLFHHQYESHALLFSLLLKTAPQTYFPVFEDIINGEDETGSVSAQIIKALLLSENPEHWKPVGNLLLAAQRQEGLRQTILEVLDFTSIGALEYMTKLILDEDLYRFSSVVRAVDSWFGFGWEAPKKATIQRILTIVLKLLQDPGSVSEAAGSRDHLEAYTAFWVKGLTNVDEANKMAFDTVFSDTAGKNEKLVALFFIHETQRTRNELVGYAENHFGKDEEYDYWMLLNMPEFNLSDPFFAKIRQRAESLPKEGKTFSGNGFSWKSYKITPDYFYRFLINKASEKQLEILGSGLAALPSEIREFYMRTVFPGFYTYSARYNNNKTEAAFNPPRGSWQRTVVLQAIQDRNESVSATGMNLFRKMELFPEELDVLEQLLARKSKHIRSGSIDVLLKQPEEPLKQRIHNLLSSARLPQRLAGLEILTILYDKQQYPDFVKAQATQYKNRALSKNESVFIDKLQDRTSEYSFENGFGIIDYDNLSPLFNPEQKFERKTGISFLKKKNSFLFKSFMDTGKIVSQLNRLISLFEKHKDYEYRARGYQDEIVTTLLSQRLDYVYSGENVRNLPVNQRFRHLVLAETWEKWYEESTLNDLELMVCLYWCRQLEYPYRQAGLTPEAGKFRDIYIPKIEGLHLKPRPHAYQTDPVLSKMCVLLSLLTETFADVTTITTFKLDVMEDMLAGIPPELKEVSMTVGDSYNHRDWYQIIPELAFDIREHEVMSLVPEQQLRFWNMQQYLMAHELNFPAKVTDIKEIIPAIPKLNADSRYRNHENTSLKLTLDLYKDGYITKEDVQLLALMNPPFFYYLDGGNNYLKNRFKDMERPPVMETVKYNMLAVELERGDLETEVSPYVKSFNVVEGTRYFHSIMQRMKNEKFDRGNGYYDTNTRSRSFSHLLKHTIPAEDEPLSDFSQMMDSLKLTRKRNIEIACFATQWADWLGDYLKIDNLKEAVWWFLAHTTDYMTAEKETVISRYSGIPKNDFSRGAIDINWFKKVYESLGKTNWKLLHESAKYLSDGMGYRRVKIYSSVLLGETKIRETLKKITEKRDKDYVMALGLIPISKANPENDLLKRYDLLQTFLKESKQFGAQRQASEANAVEIGLDNLARNAGYEDRIRFSWAMEAKAAQKIMENPGVVKDDTEIALVVTPDGKADIRVTKNGKPQKSIPAKYKKDKDILQLKAHKEYLKKQYTRTRESLENAMIREDSFSSGEIAGIMEHPVVKAMLGKLVLFNREKQFSGFWNNSTLTDPAGNSVTPDKEDKLVIAHPVHLYHAVQWDLYQKYLFDHAIVQPFKQVFRELYLPTENEMELSNRSERYQGHQVQPRKTIALLRSRGWTVNYEEGLQKVFHQHGVMATLYAMADWYSPAETEAPTLEEVCFHYLKDYHKVPLKEINPVIFSEVMRDVDLVVSVAHVGEVDPEASHSTMEMRALLATESARLFKLDNVEVKERHLLITGKLANYSVHLGSGIVFKDGLQLSIIPVHSQHRGRVFLPFMDDDPKSAEIISKMKLLAEDSGIKDPTILAQIQK